MKRIHALILAFLVCGATAQAQTSPAPTDQWRKDGCEISGATTASQIIANHL